MALAFHIGTDPVPVEADRDGQVILPERGHFRASCSCGNRSVGVDDSDERLRLATYPRRPHARLKRETFRGNPGEQIGLHPSTDGVRAAGCRVLWALRLRRKHLEFCSVLAAAKFGTVNS